MEDKASASRPADEPRTKAAAEPVGSLPLLTLMAPDQVLPEKEFGISVNLSGDENLAPSEVELSYDPAVLEAMDEGDKSGTRLLKLGKGGGIAEVRFRSVAQNPATTQVLLTNITLQEEGDKSSAPVVLPPAASIDIR